MIDKNSDDRDKTVVSKKQTDDRDNRARPLICKYSNSTFVKCCMPR